MAILTNVAEASARALNDKTWARWTALILIASMMLFAYMFVQMTSKKTMNMMVKYTAIRC